MKDGRFSIGRHSYGIVVPPSLTLRENVKLLNSFETGGRLLFVQPALLYPTGSRGVAPPASAKVVPVEAAVSELMPCANAARAVTWLRTPRHAGVIMRRDVDSLAGS